MIRNTKYIASFNANNGKTYNENVKLIYDLAISKRDDYKKTNNYAFIEVDNSIKVYQVLNIESKYPKPFYKGDIVECKEFGKGKIVKVVAGGYMRLEVLFDNGSVGTYTYYGYKYPNIVRNDPKSQGKAFLNDKLVKVI